MKKLLVLLMVLGLVGSAQAALSLTLGGQTAPAEITITVSTEIVIGVSSDNAEPWTRLVELSDVPWYLAPTKAELLFASAAFHNAGDQASQQLNFYGDGSTAWVNVGGTATMPLPGIQWDIVMHCTAPGDVIIGVYDLAENLIQGLIIHQVPEPMTMGLLGLGGLFLRRRK